MNQAEAIRSAIKNGRIYQLGASPLLWGIFDSLEIESHINQVCGIGQQQISPGRTALGVILTRLLRPQAMYKIGAWLGETGLAELLGYAPEQFNDDRLARMLEAVGENSEAIWIEVVRAALVNYPGLADQIIHYDVTSCYFEGGYADSDLVKYGYSRDHRSDAKQVEIGLSIVGKSGLPLLYELLAGNRADCTTPLEHLKKLKKVLEKAQLPTKVVMVSDRAMLNRPLIMHYVADQIGFIGPWTPREVRDLIAAVENSELQQSPLAFQPQAARHTEEARYYGVLRELPFAEGEVDTTLRVLVLFSVGKARLDQQVRERHLEKALAGLTAIQSQLNQRRYKQLAYVQQRLTKLFEQAWGAKGLITYRLSEAEGQLSLTFAPDQDAIAAAEKVEGRYALVTNTALNADELLVAFKSQCRVEQRFAILKGAVPVRPIHLHSDQRIRGLVFLTMVALLVYAILEWRIRQANLSRSRPWTGQAILQSFENFAVTALLLADGSFLWLPPPFSPDQVAIWTALDLPDLEAFLADFALPRTNCET